MLTKKHITALAGGIIVLLAFWFYSRASPAPQKLTPPQEEKMDRLFTEMKTYCAGRYLIDLPASFAVKRYSEKLADNYWVADVSGPDDSYKTYITTQKMSPPAFAQLLKRREKELREAKTINPQNMPFLKKVWSLPEGMAGVIFERNIDPSANDMGRILEGYFYSNGVAIKLQKQTTNDSAPRYEKMRDGDPVRNDVQKDINRMRELLSRMHGREDDEIPSIPGTCISHAFIATDPQEADQENTSIWLVSPQLDNISIALETDNFTREKEPMLDRADEIAANLARARGHIERKGAFKVNGLHAQEILSAGLQSLKDEPRYDFSLFINETTAGYRTPNAFLNLYNENEPATSYSQAEIIAFWDRISRTLRLRPGAF
ncbi:T6SS immunity protein Tli4 family protein [Pantoea allii]|uniref:T6SS immunity protein Tli4 family protein n=1 Tax=Pantoea allii TaxID=574096 RepID=UPI001F4EF56F|nr:T6SS immunity protein Tli4 family protein [Pantoea allii]MCH9298264.1 T6SS immunity protein Tli4 family protein [Pantoea allii]